MSPASILMVLFGCVLSMATGLTFVEVRRIRKSGGLK